jgi:DNA-binding response OmpR family regulator
MIDHDDRGQKTIRLLVIDDNPRDVEIVRAMLAQYTLAQFELDVLPSTDAAMTRLMGTQYDLVLLDDSLPGEDGLSFLQRLERAPGMPPVSMLTDNADERLATEALRRGASDFFPRRRSALCPGAGDPSGAGEVRA